MSDPSRLETTPARWTWRPPPARLWAALAVALGMAGDGVFRARPGVGLALWLAALVGAAAVLTRARGRLEPGRGAVFALGAAAALAVAVRSAPNLQVLAIGLVAVSTGWALLERPWAAGLASRVVALAAVGISAALGTPVGAAVAPRDGDGAGWRRRSAVAARGALAAAPVLLVVGALFVAGDPVFARYANRVLEAGLEQALSHLGLALVLAWIAGGVVFAVGAVRIGDLSPPADRARGFAAEAVVALVLVDLLFAAFLGVQAGALFGGRAFVEATAGVTYAEYARSGFFLLALAAAVALPTVLAAEWVVGRGPSRRRAFAAAAYGLLAGVVLVLASAAHRMGVYVDAYGWTEARLFASAFMVWLAVAALVLAGAIAAGRTERFAAGALTAAWAVFGALVVLNPSGFVVRANAEKAATPGAHGFDVRYGALELGLDAVPALAEAASRLPAAEGCRVAVHLLEERESRTGEDVRSWTLSRWRADRALESREAELRALAAGCPVPSAGSAWIRRPPPL